MKRACLGLLTLVLFGSVTIPVVQANPANPANQANHAQADHAPPKPAPVPSAQPNTEALQSEKPAPDCKELTLGHSTDWWVMIFTGVLTGATFLMWVATDANAKAAVRAARATERAEEPRMLIESRTVSGMDITEGGDLTDEIRFFWVFKNYGRSPAWIDRIEVSAAVLEAIPNHPRFSDGQNLRHVVPPGEMLEGAEPTVIDIPRALKTAVFSTDVNLFIWGRLIYRDVSRNRHESRFAYELAKNDAAGGWGRLEPVGSEQYWIFD